ncbi:RNA pseudouridine synthase 4, mitochondrial [Canna indica]|uniref:RNA pseudouridine synthase 4, mitochondrial n=1 Tax=Canna indica TaxID=4628 RepID=A0AAQ3QQ38_9LILI|nr:RNA pseudouridine synthase 4, mitochondrial [Canna indica]
MPMWELVRLCCRRSFPSPRLLSPVLLRSSHSASSASCEKDESTKPKGKWLTLPPFTPPVDAASVGKELAGRTSAPETEPMTALKWIRRCCPHLPTSLVQKLFRLRQVRKDQTIQIKSYGDSTEVENGRLRRVSAKETMVLGEVILLPVTVQKVTSETSDRSEYNDFQISFVRGLELYKDPAIIVVNKPPGMPAQGGVGIRYSMDELAANCLKYEFSEPPRLVHRLDRDSSGVLVLGRTQTSTSILHSLFREKTSGALADDINDTQRPLQRKYLALVLGTPRHSRGLISAPLAKIVLEDGKSERIIIADNVRSTSSQHALTEYKVIKTSSCGYTWLELFPLTGRKHQLRVHCANILGTPIVGDYKYGRRANQALEPMQLPESIIMREKLPKEKLPFGLELDGGSISERFPRLHLHCKQMVLPNISITLQQLQLSTDHDLSKLGKLNFVAPLPSHMQMSWDILSSLS